MGRSEDRPIAFRTTFVSIHGRRSVSQGVFTVLRSCRSGLRTGEKMILLHTGSMITAHRGVGRSWPVLAAPETTVAGRAGLRSPRAAPVISGPRTTPDLPPILCAGLLPTTGPRYEGARRCAAFRSRRTPSAPAARRDHWPRRAPSAQTHPPRPAPAGPGQQPVGPPDHCQRPARSHRCPQGERAGRAGSSSPRGKLSTSRTRASMGTDGSPAATPLRLAARMTVNAGTSSRRSAATSTPPTLSAIRYSASVALPPSTALTAAFSARRRCPARARSCSRRRTRAFTGSPNRRHRHRHRQNWRLDPGQP